MLSWAAKPQHSAASLSDMTVSRQSVIRADIARVTAAKQQWLIYTTRIRRRFDIERQCNRSHNKRARQLCVVAARTLCTDNTHRRTEGQAGLYTLYFILPTFRAILRCCDCVCVCVCVCLGGCRAGYRDRMKIFSPTAGLSSHS